MNTHHSIVVGGTKGLGRGLVQLWSESEGVISVIARRLPNHETSASKAEIRHFAADLTAPESLLPALDEIVKQSGPVTRLAFSQRNRGTGDTLEGELKVGVQATQQVIEHLVETDSFAPRAAIVVVSSVCGQFIAAEQPLGYHVTKAALDHLVRFYAVQLASKGIRVNGVAPNLILKDEGREFYRQNPELQSHYETVIPLGQMGTPRDVANAIDFLCSDRAGHITGQTLVVDGGLTVLLQHSLGVRPSFRTI
ncbi:SDR family NAD(P)-dependent oxidoreductase [Schlesneria sp. T3-172]|uniref:SDR family NAD(P)-dependent oxidoreductase n=1 Tax=Schlesneria sphaerica TaxID=3373610 RepID=UPI0037C551F5